MNSALSDFYTLFCLLRKNLPLLMRHCCNEEALEKAFLPIQKRLQRQPFKHDELIQDWYLKTRNVFGMTCWRQAIARLETQEFEDAKIQLVKHNRRARFVFLCCIRNFHKDMRKLLYHVLRREQIIDGRAGFLKVRQFVNRMNQMSRIK